MKKYPTAFAERNRITIAVVGLIACVIVFLVAFNGASLPVIGNGKTYTAHFAEAGGLKKGNEVRVAGVKVGEVTDIDLKGTTVVVKFRAKVDRLGDKTSAAVEVKTLLGRKYLSVDPLGQGDINSAIPRERTSTPYDVNAAFSDLSSTVGEIDTQQLEASFDALSAAFADTPKSVRTMVKGLSDLSRTISSRDDQIGSLLESTAEVSETLKDRNDEFAKILGDGNLLLEELGQRRQTVQAMLRGTARLGTQLRGLISDNEAQLEPALNRLDQVAAILQRNQDNLDKALRQIGPYYRMVASATGNGRWIDSYVCGLFEDNGKQSLRNDFARDCKPKNGGGK